MILKRIINADTRYICIANADERKSVSFACSSAKIDYFTTLEGTRFSMNLYHDR